MNEKKRHPLLQSISAELKGTRIAETVDVAGHKYQLQTLDSGDEDWVIARAGGGTMPEHFMGSITPRVAAALSSIDDVPVEQLFPVPEDLEPAIRERLVSNPEAIRAWRREQVLQFVREELPTTVVSALNRAYSVIDERRAEAIKSLAPFSKKTLSGD